MVREDFTIVDGEDLGWYPHVCLIIPYFGAHLAQCLQCESAILGAFNKEKDLIGAFSVIVKLSDCSFPALMSRHGFWPVPW